MTEQKTTAIEKISVPTLQLENKDLQREVEMLQVAEARLVFYHRLAKGMHEAALLPKGVNAPGAAIIMMKGHELGLDEYSSLAHLTAINGRVGIQNDAALGLLRAKGVLKPGTDMVVEWVGGKAVVDGKANEAFGCTVSLHRKGHKKVFDHTFTIHDAKKAGKWGTTGPWTTYPTRMLMHRALGFVISDRFSDVLLNLHLESELRDIPRAETTERLLPGEIEDQEPTALEAALLSSGEAAREEHEAPQDAPGEPEGGDVVDATYDVAKQPEAAEPSEEPESGELSLDDMLKVQLGAALKNMEEPSLEAALKAQLSEPDDGEVPPGDAPDRPFVADDPILGHDPEPAFQGPPTVPVICKFCTTGHDYVYGYNGACSTGMENCGGWIVINDEGKFQSNWKPGATDPAGEELRPTERELENPDVQRERLRCVCGALGLYIEGVGGRCPAHGCQREIRCDTKGYKNFKEARKGKKPMPLALKAAEETKEAEQETIF